MVECVKKLWRMDRVGILWSFWGALLRGNVYFGSGTEIQRQMEEVRFELFLGSGISSHTQKTRGRRIWVLEGWAPGSGVQHRCQRCRHLCPQGSNYSPVPDSLFIIVWLLESHFISLNFNNLQSNIWITAPTLSSLPPQKCWVSEEVIIDTLHVKPCFCEKAEE